MGFSLTLMLFLACLCKRNYYYKLVRLKANFVIFFLCNTVCVDENAYVIRQRSTNYNGIKSSLQEQRNPEKSSASFQSVPATSVDDSVSTSQYAPVSSAYASKICSTDIAGAPGVEETNEMQVDSHVAQDSEAEDDDLYLSNCRISLVGFEEKELSRLVMMIRDGGGSRHVMLSERLTHIILGAPSEE
jgi:topoisomerase (DNA) II binding protein 1